MFTVSPTGGETPGRQLTTEIRYPTLDSTHSPETKGASPASQYGPFPVIVFAHGFDTLPSTYRPLLDSWVRAGFVVVSPIFPDENATTMAADGGVLGNLVAVRLESDSGNEPQDIAFVLRQLPSVNASGPLKGLLETSDVALAGQSDGATVVAALAFSPTYAHVYATIRSAPRAVHDLLRYGHARSCGAGGLAELTGGVAGPERR